MPDLSKFDDITVDAEHGLIAVIIHDPVEADIGRAFGPRDRFRDDMEQASREAWPHG